MNTTTTVVKLTHANWDEITQKKFHLDFLNQRNAVREALHNLLEIDNEIKCTNVEIQKFKTHFDKQLHCLEEEIKRIQANIELEQEAKNTMTGDIIRTIETMNNDFAKSIEKYHLSKEKNCEAVNKNVEKLFTQKSLLKRAHEMQVDALKRFRLECDRELRNLLDVRRKSINRKFCDEFFYIDSCEKELKHIFSLIDDKSSQSGVRSSGSSSTMGSSKYSEFLMDFAWMRNEQNAKQCELFEYFKKYIAKDVIAALAAMHIYQPEEPIKFLATFLKQLKNNEFREKVQHMIFDAAKNGENLFPNPPPPID